MTGSALGVLGRSGPPEPSEPAGVVLAAAHGTELRALAEVAATVLTPLRAVAVTDLDPDATDAADWLAGQLAMEGRDELLVLHTGADADRQDAAEPLLARHLATRFGVPVTIATGAVRAHPAGGLVTGTDGRFRAVDPAGDATAALVATRLFPAPAWTAHVPARSAFVGENGLLDPVTAGVWLHADPGARSPGQRLGRLVHGLAPTPERPLIVLGTPGGPVPVVADAAAALTPELVDAALFVPFGVPLSWVRALAVQLGRPIEATTAMLVADDGGTGGTAVRTVAADGRPGWSPLVSRVLVPADGGAPEPVELRWQPEPPAPEVVVEPVPAGLWLRPADAPAAADGPRTADLAPDGIVVFVGDGVSAPDPTSGLVRDAALLVGRLEPTLRQSARTVLLEAGQLVPERPAAAAERAEIADAPAAPRPLSWDAAPTDPPREQDRSTLRAALGVGYGRLAGNAELLVALEPGRSVADVHAREHLVALRAALAAADDDALREAFTDPATAPALLRCAAAGVRCLSTHRGTGYARLHLDTLPEPGQRLTPPPFARLARHRPSSGEGTNPVLALRSVAMHRLGGLLDEEAETDLLAPLADIRVVAVERASDGAMIVYATDADVPDDGAESTPSAEVTPSAEATSGAPELPTWG